jgi:type IV pilus assembly protein PilA
MRQSGFTLIELMIVVAIVGVLATISVPTFQDRVIRAQVTEALVFADFAKPLVAGYNARHGRMPKNNAEAGLPSPEQIIGSYVTRLDVRDGAIVVTLGNRVNRYASGKHLTVRPATVPGQPLVPASWMCGNAEAPAGLRTAGKNETDLPPPYLPIECRS